jgi:hypothetical protein
MKTTIHIYAVTTANSIPNIQTGASSRIAS